MLINNDSAQKRLDNPMNLINRLRDISAPSRSSAGQKAMSLFVPPAPLDASLEKEKITLDAILSNSDTQIKLGLAHDNAVKLLNDSLGLLSAKLDDVKADKLPATIMAASKVVESIRKERIEASRDRDREVHYHFYTPQQKKMEEFEVIDVT
jgi:hypothetical protein